MRGRLVTMCACSWMEMCIRDSFSAMHSWQGQLTETERLDVLAYIRLLVQQGK